MRNRILSDLMSTAHTSRDLAIANQSARAYPAGAPTQSPRVKPLAPLSEPLLISVVSCLKSSPSVLALLLRAHTPSRTLSQPQSPSRVRRARMDRSFGLLNGITIKGPLFPAMWLAMFGIPLTAALGIMLWSALVKPLS